MKKIVVEMTPAQANALAWALTLGLTYPGTLRLKNSLARVAVRIADEIERVFPEQTKP